MSARLREGEGDASDCTSGLLVAGCLTLAASNMAKAQSYPTHPVRIIVSSAAGGPLDIVARAVAEKLTTSLKQPVVVEARSGAGGNIAADFVSKSDAGRLHAAVHAELDAHGQSAPL